jgi:hypothetical protein
MQWKSVLYLFLAKRVGEIGPGEVRSMDRGGPINFFDGHVHYIGGLKHE